MRGVLLFLQYLGFNDGLRIGCVIFLQPSLCRIQKIWFHERVAWYQWVNIYVGFWILQILMSKTWILNLNSFSCQTQLKFRLRLSCLVVELRLCQLQQHMIWISICNLPTTILTSNWAGVYKLSSHQIILKTIVHIDTRCCYRCLQSQTIIIFILIFLENRNKEK